MQGVFFSQDQLAAILHFLGQTCILSILSARPQENGEYSPIFLCDMISTIPKILNSIKQF